MTPLQLATKYLQIFYRGGDLAGLATLFHPDLVFEGPFFSGNSAKMYLDSLKGAPPTGMDYQVLAEFEKDNQRGVRSFIQ